MHTRTRRSLIAITVAVTLVVFFGYFITRNKHSAPVHVGQVAPNIQTTTVDGQAYAKIDELMEVPFKRFPVSFLKRGREFYYAHLPSMRAQSHILILFQRVIPHFVASNTQ